MKRHPSLQPLSRDHNVALVHARRLEREPSANRLFEFLQAWDSQMDDHFFEEERLLLAHATPDQGAKLINDHMLIRQYAVAARRGMLALSDIARLGGLIHDHVRWEERILFPAIEDTATPEELELIAAETERRDRERSTAVR